MEGARKRRHCIEWDANRWPRILKFRQALSLSRHGLWVRNNPTYFYRWWPKQTTAPTLITIILNLQVLLGISKDRSLGQLQGLTSQVARKSSCPKSCCPKPESCSVIRIFHTSEKYLKFSLFGLSYKKLPEPFCSFCYLLLTVKTNLGWKRSSGWLESWEGLLLLTDVSTTCAEAIFEVKW